MYIKTRIIFVVEPYPRQRVTRSTQKAKAMPSGIGPKNVNLQCLLQLLIVVLLPADKAVHKGCSGAAWVIVVCVCVTKFSAAMCNKLTNRC